VLAVLVVAGVVLAVNRAPRTVPAARPSAHPAPASTPTPPVVLDLQFVSGRVGYVEVNGQPARVYRSTDAGQTWSIAWEGPEAQFHFVDADHGFLYSSHFGGLLATADGGGSWSFRNWPQPGIPAAAAFAAGGAGLAVFPGPLGLVAGARPALVYRTADGGASWAPTATLYGPSDRAPATEYVAGMGLTDGGLAWVLFDAGLSRSLAVSRDGGSSWAQVDLPLAPGAGLVDPVLHLDGSSGTLVLTTQWVAGPVNVNGNAMAFPAPAGPVPTYLYRLGENARWSGLKLPAQPFDGYAAALDGAGSGFLLGAEQDCRLTVEAVSDCGPSTLGATPVEQLQLLGDGTLVASEGHLGVGMISADGGAHWRLLALPLSR
jgi:hypothetical protein